MFINLLQGNNRGTMKKLVVITFLLIFIVCGIFSTGIVCVADNANNYIASSPIDLYTSKDNTKIKSCQIPATYYVQVNNGADFNADYIPVKYQGQDFFVTKADFDSKKLTKYEKAVESPFYSPESFAIKSQQFDAHFGEPLKKVTYDLSIVEEVTFIGFYSKDSINYYCVNLKVDPDFYPTARLVYIKVSDTSTDIVIENVPKHPNSIATPEPNDPNPDGNNNDFTPPATNNLTRNILIAIICGLSVLVVFLIFKPSKSKNK